jgi:hypothetical protein
VIQLVLPLHECAAESIADPIAVEPVTDPAATESVLDPTAAEPLHFVADPATIGAALTETSCLYVHV